MNVLNVTLLIDPQFGGGTSERTCQMSRSLVRLGEDCAILTTDAGLSADRIQSLKGVRVIALPCFNRRFYLFRFSYKELKKIISQSDVIHLMGHWSILNVLIYFLAKSTNTPYVICPAGELNVFGRTKFLKRLFNFIIGQKIIDGASGYIAVSKNEYSEYHKYGIPQEKVTFIPNGVNTESLIEFNENTIPIQFQSFASKPYVLFMGRLNYIKGPDLLLSAFIKIAKDFPLWQLVFAGPDGGLLHDLQEAVRQNCLSERVHFVGYVSGYQKIKIYKDAKFLVIPSRQEAMSIVVLEAGICGIPVLITDACGFNEVEEIAGGVVVPPNAEGIKIGLLELLANDHKLIGMGENLMHFTAQNFTWEIACKRYLEIYTRIIAKLKIY